MSKPVKCFIVEGEDRDYRFIQDMSSVFFKGRYELVTIFLAAEQNIYMLYNRLKEDDFETDLIEILREENKQAEEALTGIDRQDIDEVYLMFDYDIHQRNLSEDEDPNDVLEKMLQFYNNETENGKLYISYPMVEALYDYQDGYCEPYSDCRYPIARIAQYKQMSGMNNPHASHHLKKYEEWKMILSVYGLRIQCLFDVERLDYQFYRNSVTVESIFHKQRKYIDADQAVFILSAFPEFLLDYFKPDFWAKHVNRHKKKFENCPKEQQNQL